MPRAEQSSMEKATLGELEVSESHACDDHKSPELVVAEEAPVYRLYKRRFLGVVGLFLLNVAAGMTYPWFGPIANDVASDFNISLTRVNWLSNVTGIIYLPVALCMPLFCSRYGVRRSCEVGSVCLIISAWVRYAGTAQSLSTNGAYALLLVGQIVAGVAQPIFQILAPIYAELWFDLRGRGTATTILSISNIVGGAIAQLISPEVGGVRPSVLVLAIITTVIAPCCFLVGSRPPTPPTLAGSLQSPSLLTFVRAWVGLSHPPEAHMSIRERIDFTLIWAIFSTLVAASTDFSILTNQIFQPYGYDSSTSGLFGATLLLAGLVSAIASGPLFDRVLTHHLALSVKIFCPILGAGWFGLIWAARENNTGALFALMAVMGACSLPLLPVGLELSAEVTRNADASSALLFFGANALGAIFLGVENALREGPEANPPLNMRRALIFQGVIILAVCLSVFGVRGEQTRRRRDAAAADGDDIQMRQAGDLNTSAV